MWYFSPGLKDFPSKAANNLQMMKACSAFAMAGQPTTFVVPKRYDTVERLECIGGNPWYYYAVPHNFELEWLSFPYPFSVGQDGVYAPLVAFHARWRGISTAYTRSVWQAVLLSVLGITVILEIHDYHPRLDLRMAMLMAQKGRLSSIVCISEALAKTLLNFGFPGDTMMVAHDAVDLERFEPRLDIRTARSSLCLDQNKAIVVYCGNLHHDRLGIETLLASASGLPQVEFIFVGGEPERVEFFRTRCEMLGIQNVRFVGYIPNYQVPSYLFAANVLVMPYTRETPHYSYISPLKLFEYLAAGRPIVSSDFPVLREILVDGQNGLLVEPANEVALSSTIKRVLSDSQLALRLSEQALHTAHQNTWINRQIKVLEFIAARRTAKSIRG